MEGAVDDDHVAAGRGLSRELDRRLIGLGAELQKNTLPPRLDPDRRSARRIAGSV